MKFNLYSDPGHGWLKVPKKLIKKLNLQEEISIFSYIRGDHVYLEEDSDLAKFMNAMKKAGKTVEFREYHANKSSRIRNYRMYQ